MKAITNRFLRRTFLSSWGVFKLLRYIMAYSLIVAACFFFYSPNFRTNETSTRNAGRHHTSKSVIVNSKIEETQIDELRKKARLENRDEFLDEVLQELNFTEVVLSLSRDDIDVENDRSIQMDLNRIVSGLSDGGQAATVPPEKQEEATRVIKAEYLNRLLSDHISYNRDLPDFREPECKIVHKYARLPKFSVVMIFANEPFSIFMRSIHSILNRTPEILLEEIILVDDYSDHPELHSKLTRYLATRFPSNKLRLIRLSRRSGLIRARMIGAHVAVGEVLVFLDAHIEVTNYWAEPLLQRISENRTIVVSPVVDEIDRYNYKYYYSRSFHVGSFGWGLFFKWIPIQPHVEKNKPNYCSPTKSPTMIGGLFGIERKYFWEIGSYDSGMLIWGGENIEMSFRIWQCGGSLEIIPCSRVGHVYRHARPNSVPAGMPSNTFALNSARLAEVWMDEFKDVYYMESPKLDTFDVKRTNISMRQAFRKRKKCRSFKWYMENVEPERFLLQFTSKLFGQFKNVGANLCLDRNGHYEREFLLGVYPCNQNLSRSQTFYLSTKGELRLENECATAFNSSVKMIKCNERLQNDVWDYTSDDTWKNVKTNKCLALIKSNKNDKLWATELGDCLSNNEAQKWKLKTQ